ncbi:DMT family transporter [Pseudoalteromonas maricaloris]|uniref:DMT family transporter n=1 Tax=Pseudoalteromonas maricaloris TaxID=184924 RepID=A0A8I2H3E8_9GAMM|nr:DMT family transporter [Pseudoalteromonas maricaloris]NLR20379.1 EamA family transporter [Pseudoalteromonas maricaloris]WOX27039.1 DMT family transporter [Pseudoalteromonas maricaloris]
MFGSDKEKGSIEMIIAMVLSGTIGYFVVSAEQSYWNVVFLRCVIGALCLLGYVLVTKQLTKEVFKGPVFMTILLGGIALVGNWVLLFASFDYIPFSISIIAYHLQPLMLVLLSAVFYRQYPSKAILLWLAIAVVGLWLVVGIPYQEIVAVIFAQESNQAVFGLLLALGAAFLYTITTLMTKKVSQVPSGVVAVIQIFFGGLFLLPWVDFSHFPVTSSSWGNILFLGVVNTGFMYVIMYDAFQRLSTTLIAILSFIYPVVALLVDFIAFEHTILMLQTLGIVLILTAVSAVKFDWKLGKLFNLRFG